MCVVYTYHGRSDIDIDNNISNFDMEYGYRMWITNIDIEIDIDIDISNIDIVSVHCREEGCIGKYTPRCPRDFPRAGILHPEAREIARGKSRGPRQNRGRGKYCP